MWAGGVKECLQVARLCRARGLGCACLNDVRLTHLERQSFSSLGDDGFRHAVVILNAVRQQQRWGEAIAEQVKGASV